MPTTSTASGHISPSFFPGEILGEVFSHCDRTTLATVVSLVSFDCLALSARLLYEDVTVDTAQRLARLLRIPHPDTTPGFDPTHFTFDTNYPDGFPIPSRPSPNRVTPCSSLSLVHSITFSGSPNGSTASYLGDYYVPPDEDDEKDEGYCEPFAFLDSLAAFQPLELAVLVIDFPDAGSEEWFGPFMTLFDPVKFVLRARAGCRWTIFELRGKAQNWDMPWSRLTTVILSGVQLLDCHQLDIGERPIRVFVDLTWVKEDVAMQIHATHDPATAPGDFKVRAWVSTDTIKSTMEERVESNDLYGIPGVLGEDTFVDIASERILRFRDELLKGVHKKMDWAALDEI